MVFINSFAFCGVFRLPQNGEILIIFDNRYTIMKRLVFWWVNWGRGVMKSIAVYVRFLLILIGSMGLW